MLERSAAISDRFVEGVAELCASRAPANDRLLAAIDTLPASAPTGAPPSRDFLERVG